MTIRRPSASTRPRGKKPSTKEKPPEKQNPIKDIEELLVYKLVGVSNLQKHFFDETFHPADYIQHCREGNTHSYIIAAWGISNETFRSWVAKYKKMADAAKMGRTCFSGFWQMKAREEILGMWHGYENKKPFNTYLFTWWSKNTMGWTEQGGDEFVDAGPVMDFTITDETTGETFNAHLEKIEKAK